MVEDHPIRGVGAGNFQVSSIHYLLRPGRTGEDQLIIDTPKVPHNIYLQVLSELGIVGFTLFAVILASSLRCALLAARNFARRNELRMELFARGLFISLVGLLAAEFFSSQLFSKQLWLLLATGPALLAISRHGMDAGGDRVTPWSPVRTRAARLIPSSRELTARTRDRSVHSRYRRPSCAGRRVPHRRVRARAGGRGAA